MTGIEDYRFTKVSVKDVTINKILEILQVNFKYQENKIMHFFKFEKKVKLVKVKCESFLLYFGIRGQTQM